MRYYLVTAKCGHVGKGKYYEVQFPIRSESKSEAAQYCLTKPKVKKQLHNAISSVEEITYEEYIEKAIALKEDLYIKAHTKREISDYFENAKLLPSQQRIRRSSFESRAERICFLFKKYKIKEESYCA